MWYVDRQHDRTGRPDNDTDYIYLYYNSRYSYALLAWPLYCTILYCTVYLVANQLNLRSPREKYREISICMCTKCSFHSFYIQIPICPLVYTLSHHIPSHLYVLLPNPFLPSTQCARPQLSLHAVYICPSYRMQTIPSHPTPMPRTVSIQAHKQLNPQLHPARIPNIV